MSDAPQSLQAIDPALAEIIRRGPVYDGEIAIIARLSAEARLPDGAHVITRFGDIATLRIPLSALEEFMAQDDVITVEATHRLRFADDMTEAGDVAQFSENRPAGIGATGHGVMVGVLDWGCDFAHPDFCNPDGTTRISMLWDQRSHANEDGAGTNRWGYGRIFDRAMINKALQSDDPYGALGYHPQDADSRDSRNQWRGSHGTHVLSIAAGNGRAGGPVGIAPQADLAFVHLDRIGKLRTQGTLGDAASLLEGLDAVFEAAGGRPVVANFSVGAHGGPHDGSTLVEAGIDAAVSLQPGRAVVNSAGNYRTRRAHAQGRIKAKSPTHLRFEIPVGDKSSSEIEVFYPIGDSHTVTLIAPDKSEVSTAQLQEQSAITVDGENLGQIYHQNRNRTDGPPSRLVNIFLDAKAPVGVWTLSITPKTLADGRFDAWIERESAPAPKFLDDHVSEVSTTGTLCNGRKSITVGAFDPKAAMRKLGSFSSLGPTRDGRVKPELIAPGVRVVAAKSRVGSDMKEPAGYTSKNGTSMAAPFVAGTVALMFEAAGQPLRIEDTRALLLGSVAKSRGRLPDLHGRGYGAVDVIAAERAAKRWKSNHSGDPEDSGRDAEGVTEPRPDAGLEQVIEEDPLDPVAVWDRDRAAAVVLFTKGEAFLVSGAQIDVRTPGPDIEKIAPKGKTPSRDVFGIPSIGAGGTRIFRTGNRQAVFIDFGKGPKQAGGAIYLDQLAGVMQRMGITDVRAVVVIHRHLDHYDQLAKFAKKLGVTADKIFMPRSFLQNAPPKFLEHIRRLAVELEQPLNWRPKPLKLRPMSNASDVVQGRFRAGAEVFDFVALGRELRQITGKTADKASLLVRYRSGPGHTPIVVLGDLRGADLKALHDRMGKANWGEFFRGVQTVSGFHHHRGRIETKHVEGVLKLLETTLFKTGKLTALIQTNPADSRSSAGRRATLDFLRNVGVTVKEVHTSAGSQPSSVGSTGSSSTALGPASRVHTPITSRMTEALQRIERLNMAKRVLTLWGPQIRQADKTLAGPQNIQNIDAALNTLRSNLRKAADAFARHGQGTQWQAALSNIPPTTRIETSIGAKRFQTLKHLSQVPSKDVPKVVAVRRALKNGTFDPGAFRYMLSQLEPSLRKQILYGRRGGLRPLPNAMARLQSQFDFRRSMLAGTGQMNIANLGSARARAGGKGLIGFLAAIELLNIAADVKKTISLSRQTARNINVYPSFRRIGFWQTIGVTPNIAAFDSNWVTPNKKSIDPAEIVKGLKDDRWDYLWLSHSPSSPVFSDGQILRMIDVLGQTIRNYDEYATFFKDLGQDALTWQSKGNWSNAKWYVTAGDFQGNRVAEKSVELPLLTQGMRAITKRIVKNTSNQLGRIAKGLSPDGAELGEMRHAFSRMIGRAKLKSAQSKLKVEVSPVGGKYKEHVGITTEVNWAKGSFFVWGESEDHYAVSGANFNSYARIRNLSTYRYQLNIGGRAGRTWYSKQKLGNQSGKVHILKSDLDFEAN